MEKEISSMACDTCLADNLIQKIGILECMKCGNPFCIHFASRIDPTYCVSCFSDLNVTKEIITKTVEHYNPVTDQITKYSRRAREIKIGGLDWLWSQRLINTLSDAELDLTIEFHRNYLNLLGAEADLRKIKKARKNAHVKVLIPATISTTTTVKQVSKTSSSKQQAQLAAVMASMISKGITPDMLQAMLSKK